jgi:predicted  nucleic acid-binding Zn-ribbon protein
MSKFSDLKNLLTKILAAADAKYAAIVAQNTEIKAQFDALNSTIAELTAQNGKLSSDLSELNAKYEAAVADDGDADAVLAELGALIASADTLSTEVAAKTEEIAPAMEQIAVTIDAIEVNPTMASDAVVELAIAEPTVETPAEVMNCPEVGTDAVTPAPVIEAAIDAIVAIAE